MQNWIGDWIGKPLLTCGGERIGYIRSVQTDGALTRVRNLECCDEDEEEFLLPFSAVERFGKDAAVVRALAPPCKEGVSAPFGRSVFSRSGEKLGMVDDLAHDGAKVTALLLSGGLCIPTEQIVGVADALIVDLTGKGRRVARRPAKKAQNGSPAEKPSDGVAAAKVQCSPAEKTSDGAEQALPLGAAAAENAEPRGQKEEARNPSPEAPMRIRITRSEPTGPAAEEGRRTGAPPGRLAGSALLTGKTLPDDLLDARGALLAPRGTVVDAAVIRRALRHNKLFALTQLCTRGQ